jgi:hypothetical protein
MVKERRTFTNPRKKFIETLITVGGIIGAFLSVFQLSTGVVLLFSFFILFSLIYYVLVLEDLYDYNPKSSAWRAYKAMVSNFVGFSFSGLFAIMYLRSFTTIGNVEIMGLLVIYGILGVFLSLYLNGYNLAKLKGSR